MKSITLNMSKKLRLLAISIGIIYIIFGILKFFPHYSPAESIAIETIGLLSLGLISAKTSLLLLAWMEVIIGVLLVLGIFTRQVIMVTFFHLLCTFSPLFLLPDQTFQNSMLSPSLLGQYILKNVVLICALIAIYPSPNKVSQ